MTEVAATEEGTQQALLLPGETAEAPPEERPRVLSPEEVLDNVLRDLGPGEPGPDDPVN